MIRAEFAAAAAARRFRIDGHGAGAWIHPYFGTERERPDGTAWRPGDPSPMLYRVQQDPDTAIATHFHQVDQFQVVLRGDGHLGRERLDRWSVHFAGAYTGYGPLRAGRGGLDYLTARRAWDPGLRPLPEARHELDGIGERRPVNRVVAVAPDSPGGPLIAPDAPHATGAWMVVLEPGRATPLPGDAACDRCLVVVSECVRIDGCTLAADDAAFLPAGSAPVPAAVAGPAPARCLLLQFRNPS